MHVYKCLYMCTENNVHIVNWLFLFLFPSLEVSSPPEMKWEEISRTSKKQQKESKRVQAEGVKMNRDNSSTYRTETLP